MCMKSPEHQLEAAVRVAQKVSEAGMKCPLLDGRPVTIARDRCLPGAESSGDLHELREASHFLRANCDTTRNW
jgi:hypothetical protein